jgi:hypothetical protein
VQNNLGLIGIGLFDGCVAAKAARAVAALQEIA